jgi:DNA-binding LytR/AlgR family response regulator
MRYVIIEDEQLAAKRLRLLIEDLRPDYEYVAKFDSVESATISMPVLRYDLVFMDIQLADGTSFDIFDQISLKTPIIFTTAYDEYAVQAFKTNSIDYLLKPIGKDDLVAAIEKFESLHLKEEQPPLDHSPKINELIKTLQPGGKERFVVKIGEHLRTVDSKNIQLIYSHDKGTYLFSAEGKKYLIDYSLDRVAELMDPNKFFKISRKFIVNADYIKDIIAFTNSRLEIIVNLFDEDQIIVAREKVSDFKQWLDR